MSFHNEPLAYLKSHFDDIFCGVFNENTWNQGIWPLSTSLPDFATWFPTNVVKWSGYKVASLQLHWIGDHRYITSALFWNFCTLPVRQHKCSAERQQRWTFSDFLKPPTHPVLMLTYYMEIGHLAQQFFSYSFQFLSQLLRSLLNAHTRTTISEHISMPHTNFHVIPHFRG